MNWWILMRPVVWFVVFGAVASVLAFRLIRVFERRMGQNVAMSELESRVAQLEESAENARQEMHRLREGQDFMSRLLMDKSPAEKIIEAEAPKQW